MTNEPSWDEIFQPKPSQPSQPASAEVPPTAQPVQPAQPVPAAAAEPAPQSRREAREAEAHAHETPKREKREKRGGATSGGGFDDTPQKPKRKRRFAWVFVLLAFLVVVGGTAAYGWINYEPQIRSLLGWELPNDYEGTGTDEEVVIVIQDGQIGQDVARTLAEEGVTMTYTAFYRLLLAQDPQVNFQPGNYTLHKQMSAKAALEALQDPANKVTNRVTITEGSTLLSTLTLLSEATEIPLADFEAAAKDYTSFGVPAEAPSLEGYLFPATYPLEPGQSARDVLTVLVNEMFERLDAAGVAVEDRHRVLTLAALIQREAGSDPEDFYKVSRVFTNRLAKDWKLESDATVTYGTGKYGTVWTTAEERQNAEDKYNTYANKGLPIGPIGAPGDLAIAAAISPVEGPWLFFVTVDLKTGETVFSETLAQHNAGVDRLRAWCRASADNKAYCD